MTPFVLTLTASLLGGCGTKSSCHRYAKAICDNCKVGEEQVDTVCACLKDGEVRQASKYFENHDAADMWCASLKTSLEAQHLSEDDLAECDGKLDVMDKYDRDACEVYGYSPKSGGSDDTGDYEYEYEYEYDADADADADADVDVDVDTDATQY